jgi:hypothetical protein
MEEFNKVRIVLKSLMSGLSVEIDGISYRMSEDYDILYEMAMYGIDDPIPTKTYVGTYMSVKRFSNMCLSLTNEETMILAANLALNDV